LRFERAWIEVEVKSGCEAPDSRTLRNGYDREEAEPVDETSINPRIDEQHSRVPLNDERIFIVQPEFSHPSQSSPCQSSLLFCRTTVANEEERRRAGVFAATITSTLSRTTSAANFGNWSVLPRPHRQSMAMV